MEDEGRFARGWRLAGLSWNVIQSDRSLLALPGLQLLFQLAVVALVFGPFALSAERQDARSLLFVGGVVAMLPLNIVSTFFGVAFVTVLRGRLAGDPVSAREGLRFARSRWRAIVGWAILATAVGLAIQALERVRGGALAARLAGWLLGSVWALATLFVLPVMAATDLGAIATARESAQIARRKWGEALVGTTAIGVAFGLLFLPVGIVAVIGYTSFANSPAFGVAALVLAGGLLVVLMVAQGAVDGVFRVALYDYATTETVQAPFSASDLEVGLRPKRRWFRRS